MLRPQVRQLLWRDNRYRGAFAAPAPSIARVRLGPMLASLRGALGALKPEHLLPDAHFDPPGTVVVASRDDAPRASTTITSSTMLKANPLVAVLRYSDVPRDSDGEEWEAVDGDGGAGAGETSLAGSVSGDDSRRGARHAGRSEGGGSDSDSGDVDTNAGSGAESEAPAGGPESLLPGHQGYVVHLNYGNERLESHMRTEIQVRPLGRAANGACVWRGKCVCGGGACCGSRAGTTSLGTAQGLITRRLCPVRCRTKCARSWSGC